MAIFGKQANKEAAKDQETTPATAPVSAAPAINQGDIVVQPRLSEKSVALDKLNKFVFLVKKNSNKIEIRKALEKFYGIKILRVNVVNMKGKTRRQGRAEGRTRDYKKAIVTLTKDSKKPALLEAK